MPSLTLTYPNDEDVEIPIGISIVLTFDKGIDLKTAQNMVVVYGPDFDFTSGPDQVSWTHPKTAENEFFLRSPGFQGFVPTKIVGYYVDPDTGEVHSDPIYDSDDEEDLKFRLVVTPENPLAANTLYKVFVVGDPDEVGAGISTRTIFDVESDLDNQGDDALVYLGGTYTRTLADRVIVEITHAGDIGTAKYRWYYESSGVGSAVSGKVTGRRFRKLDDGLQVRFGGSDFAAGDIYRVTVVPAERMQSNTEFSFTTNDGSFSEPPESPSTPASSGPPGSLFPWIGPESGAGALRVVESLPADRSYNVDILNRKIVIVFNHELDPATVTQESVGLSLLPATGEYSDTFSPKVLSKKLTVENNTLTIEF